MERCATLVVSGEFRPDGSACLGLVRWYDALGCTTRLMVSWNKRPLCAADTWREVKHQRCCAYEDDSDTESGLKRAYSPPPWEDDSTYDEGPSMKRRHIDREMNGHMLQMSIQDSRATAPESTCIHDEDMTHGNSYEIAPDRIYVHSLDDDDDDNSDVTDSSWQVHPRIARHLNEEEFRRLHQRLNVPRWIAPSNEPDPPKSLVLWKPPLWTPATEEPAESMDIGS